MQSTTGFAAIYRLSRDLCFRHLHTRTAFTLLLFALVILSRQRMLSTSNISIKLKAEVQNLLFILVCIHIYI